MPHKSLLLADLFWNEYVPRRLAGRSNNTIHQHVVALRHLESFLGRAPVLADLTNQTIAAFQSWFCEGRKAITVNKTLDKLQAQWRYLQNAGYVKLGPDLRRLPEPEVIPAAWTKAELKRLLDACKKQAGYVAGVKASAWWLALHACIWDSGERIGAILQVRWSDMDLAGGWMNVLADYRKGRQKGRAYRLHPQTVTLLKSAAAPKRDLVFPWDRDRRLLWPEYSVILMRAGLPADRRSKFHRLRRSVASHYKANGGDACDLLGHSSRKVTAAYLDPRIAGEPQAVDLLPRI